MATKKNTTPIKQEADLPSASPAEQPQIKDKKIKAVSGKTAEKKVPATKKITSKVDKKELPAMLVKPGRKAKAAEKGPVEKATSDNVPAEKVDEVPEPITKTRKIALKKKEAVIVPEKQEPKKQQPAKKTARKASPVIKADTLSITFQLRFSSQLGQQLFITGNHDALGNNEMATAIPMQYFNHEFWYATINLTNVNKEDITYRYFVKNADGTISAELDNDKQVQPSLLNADELLIIDSWNYAGYYENTFYTEPFKQVLLKENFTTRQVAIPATYTHTFKVKAPLLPKDYVVCLAGSVEALGKWEPENVLPMGRLQNEDWFTVNVDFSNVTFPVAYKYGVYDLVNKKLVSFEEGNNRVVYDVATAKKLTILADGFIKLPNNTFKGAGISVPVFSLRSKTGFGVGEFADLNKLVDWAKVLGLRVIQILPVNDTTATHTNADSYPYAAISAFALHPMYLHLPTVVIEKNKDLLTGLEKIKLQLNNADAVDYIAVVKAKLDFVRKIFPSQKQETFATEDFNTFFTTNAHWLVPYAAFCYFRDEYGTADFTKWPTYNSFDVFEINELATPVLTAKDEISIHYFIQYHLHLQLKAATEYAHANGIIVKGDIPIGIFRNSCDAWQQPQLYHMDMQAGAPPDDFAVAGQNWGFPTYNWQRMAEDGFGWWKNRFEQMSYYFDAFRIDHILGFFRIWSIPLQAVEGVMGYFVPAIPVHINEFNERAIWFDHYRYTKPFINDAVLAELFGSDAEQVKFDFVEKKLFDNYELLPAFDTQKKVADHFAGLEETKANTRIKQGLFDLISNVILFEVEGSQGQQYHFRISVENTSSFRFLNEGTKHQLRELYINYFYRRQDDFWMKEAMQKLPELKRSTNMLICGEDLGMVPACVPGVMKDLGILSLEIQRMPKDPSKEFFHPNDAPYLSVVTPSTHDMSTIRGWWEEDRAKTQKFYNQELGQMGNAPYFCESWINKAIILQHLYSPAMWSIFQLQDILGMSETLRRQNPAEERINIPADPKHYWQYRMHINMEDLVEEVEFTNELAGYIKLSGR